MMALAVSNSCFAPNSRPKRVRACKRSLRPSAMRWKELQGLVLCHTHTPRSVDLKMDEKRERERERTSLLLLQRKALALLGESHSSKRSRRLSTLHVQADENDMGCQELNRS